MSRRARLGLALAAIAVFAASCGTEGAPTAYDQQIGEFTSDLTGETVEVPLVEANYRRGCEKTHEDGKIQGEDAVQYCECTFDKFVDNVPFRVFEVYNDKIVDNAEAIENGNFDDLQRLYSQAIDELEEELEAANATVETDLSVILGSPCV
ncbi:MAG: hypothetical protein HKN26_10055 [Acidimicrobiales bacterium]|nr:hypothetical protein [Acidimicrobiales bacterium]